MVEVLSDQRETMFMPAEMEMSTSATQVATGKNGTTVIGLRLTGQRKTMAHETAC
jgi:hypothetical protein